jgi:hypothetical protein
VYYSSSESKITKCRVYFHFIANRNISNKNLLTIFIKFQWKASYISMANKKQSMFRISMRKLYIKQIIKRIPRERMRQTQWRSALFAGLSVRLSRPSSEEILEIVVGRVVVVLLDVVISASVSTTIQHLLCCCCWLDPVGFRGLERMACCQKSELPFYLFH